MTSSVLRNKGFLASITISCDQIDCSTAVTDVDIESQGGLRAMGWQVLPVPGTLHHYCPDHVRAPTSSNKE